ncbi:hypothetical protein HAX54_003041 [Datura stramonium]|uniref:Uncharacterized protein n=1 Tax=Datura stramonium TaxID=4076 RepID=A0ABS8WU96_DATST|nr:hypothetical protein [Datura stramonium]
MKFVISSRVLLVGERSKIIENPHSLPCLSSLLQRSVIINTLKGCKSLPAAHTRNITCLIHSLISFPLFFN